MKKSGILFSILIAMIVHLPVFAQDDYEGEHKKKYGFVKTKSLNKTYTVDGNDKLNIRNSFGKVEVHTWNKNEIKVDVSVEVSANKEALAQKIIDGISINEKQSGGNVSVETKIEGNSNGKSDKSSMEVNYSIYMPATGPLQLSNEFGATVIPDYKGRVELTSKFGSLTTGALADVKTILVEFGRADIESAANADITIKFSSADLGKLSGATKLKFEFCSASKIVLDNSLTSADLNCSYSTVNLKPAPGLSAAYTIATSFGDFKNRTGINFSSDEEEGDDGPKFDFKYEGKSGNGSIPVKIKTSFGKVVLGEATGSDMEDNDKQKQKRKTS